MGCPAEADVVVTNDQVIASATGFMTCANIISITANNPALQGATGTWTIDNPQGQVIANSTSYLTDVSNLRPNAINRLRWTVTRNTCSASDTANIEYFVPNAKINIPNILHGCSDTIALTADTTLAGGIGSWSMPLGSLQVIIDDSTLPATTARNLEIGNNVFRWTVTNRGCTAYADVSINNSKPINTAGTDQAGCASAFTMNAQAPPLGGSGVWQTISGTVTYSNSTLATTNVVVAPGINILQWTITHNGCSSTKQFRVENHKTNPFAGNNDTICQNNVSLAASSLKPVENGIWTIDGGTGLEIFSNASVNNPSVTNLGQGKTTFVWTVTNGICTDESRVEIINNTPIINAGKDSTICGTEINLYGNSLPSGTTGIWSNPDSYVQIANPTSYSSHVTNLRSGNNEFTWTVDNGKCVASDKVVITSNSISVTAGVDQSGCADTLLLSGYQPKPGETGVWSISSGSGIFDNSTRYNTTARNLGKITSLTWTIKSGTCDYSSTFTYTNNLPTKAVTEDDKPVCDDFSPITAKFMPNASAGERGYWEPYIGSVIFENSTLYQTNVSNLTPGTNVIKWTIENNLNCKSTDLLTITNNKVTAYPGFDQLDICDSSATLGASVPFGIDGVWSTTALGVIIVNPSSANTAVNNLNFGSNIFSWTVNSNGCSDSKSVTLFSSLSPGVSAGRDTSICSGTYTLKGTLPDQDYNGKGKWKLQGGNGVFADDTNNQSVVSNLANGNNRFQWTVTVKTCSVSKEVSINNRSIPVSAGIDKLDLCNTDNYQLNGTQPGAGISGTWTNNGGAGVFDNSTVYNTIVRNPLSGINSYRWTLTDGYCTNSATVQVINNTPDSAKIEGLDKFICVDSTILSANNPTIGVGRWYLHTGSGTIMSPTSYNTRIQGLGQGLNAFRWTVDNAGCKLSDTINVTNNVVTASIETDSIVVCSSLHNGTLVGSPLKTGETGVWTKVSSGAAAVITSSTSNITAVTNLDYGNTRFRWTVSNGASCSASDEVVVINNYDKTTSASLGITPPVCGDNVPILGSAWPSGASGKWTSTSPSVTFDNSTAISTTARGLPQGTTTLVWTVTKNGCASPASISVVNSSIYTSAGARDTICQDSTNLNALALLPGQTGVWSKDNALAVIDDINSPTTLVTDLINGDNTFTWTVRDIASGCQAISSVVISNNAFTVTAGSNNISCGPSYNLSGSDPVTGTGIWTVISGTGNFANQTSFNTQVNGMNNGANSFKWEVTKFGCTSSAIVTITNDKYPAVVDSTKLVCSSTTNVVAQLINPISGATGAWTAISGGGIFSNSTNNTTGVTNLALGDNRLRWTVTKGTCSSFDEIIVSNRAITASAGLNDVTCFNYYTLNASPLGPNEVGVWSSGGVGAIFSSSTSASTNVSGLNPGINTFAWKVTNTVTKCEATPTVQITSNYFTPYAGPDASITVDNYTMKASTNPPGSTGVWSGVSGSGSPATLNDPSTLVTNLGYGKNTFRWTVSWNFCTYTDDVTITYSNMVVDAGKDTFICSPNWVLEGNDPGIYGGTGLWTRVSGSGGTIINPTNPVTAVEGIKPNSVNIFRWTVTINGHSLYDQVTIINKEFNLSGGPDSTATCGTSVDLSADPPGNGTGEWKILVGSGTFSSFTDPKATVTDLGEGANRFEWTVAKTGGCTKSDTITVYQFPSPNASFTTNVTEGCSPLDVVVTNNSSGATSYFWNFTNGYSTDTNPAPVNYTVTNGKDSIFNITLIAKNDYNCTDTSIRQVTVFSMPYVNFEANPPETEYYDGIQISLTNMSNTSYPSYNWNFGDGENLAQTSYVPMFYHNYETWSDGKGDGYFTITLNVSSGNCTNTVSKKIKITAPRPKDNSGRHSWAGCEPHAQNFQAATQYADKFYWEFGDGSISELENPTYIYDTPGKYIVKLRASGDWENDSVILIRTDTVDVWPTPKADFIVIPDTVMLPNQPIHCYDRSSDAKYYNWDFGIGLQYVSDEPNPVFYYTEPGTYNVSLSVWSEHNCSDIAPYTWPVVVEPAGVCKFPNAFSPSPDGSSGGAYISGDPHNDVFYPLHRGVMEYKLEIFNRWGEKIFESTDIYTGWDGYVDGKIAAQDVYVWKVTGKYKNGVPFKDAGDITLLR
jgi:PKD repeat protein